MSLFFLGDFVNPNGDLEFPLLKSLIKPHDKLILNLEGPILDDKVLRPINPHKYNLYSNNDALDRFKDYDVSLILANNHINDFKRGLNATIDILENDNKPYFGTDKNPYIEYKNTDDNQNYCVFAFNSKLTLPVSNKGVNSIDKDSLAKVKRYREKNPNTTLIVISHCGLELSPYPVPADRELFKKFIDLGVDSVIAHHPHIVQDVEKYKGKYIFYSIGNFAIPETVYLGKKLNYNNPLTNLGYIIQFENKENIRVHRVKMHQDENKVSYDKELNIDEMLEKNPFKGFSNKQYLQFYTKNKKASKYYPTFDTYGNFSFTLKYNYILLTQFIRTLLIKSKLYNPYS
ncbi:CapA family protein [Winogradskyella rapida]|uniref:CapA family protein n=1 Tax=Winogradskyella rapida TaxID=549701 RepID=A0ABW3KVT3_9FLAO